MLYISVVLWSGTEPQPTWESCLERARATRAYVDACLLTLSNPAATLPADRKAAKDEFEWRTPLHLLKALREVPNLKLAELSTRVEYGRLNIPHSAYR